MTDLRLIQLATRAAGLVAKKRNAHWAYDDLIGEALEAAVKARSSFNGNRALTIEGYVFLRAYGGCLDCLRKLMHGHRRFWVDMTDLPGDLVDDSPLPDHHHARREYAAILGPLVTHLPKRESTIIVERFVNGRDMKDIAKNELGTSRSRASQIMCNALVLLRQRIRYHLKMEDL